MRRKKCDEVKPACSQCVGTGRICDFLSFTPQTPIILKLDCIPLHDVDVLHFEYFRAICVPEFSLYFQQALWETVVLQTACSELFMRHAALAIGALSRSHYHPTQPGEASLQVESAVEYAIRQYNLAIQKLNEQLNTSPRSLELAILGSIVFIAVEFLQGYVNRVQMHLDSAFAIFDAHSETVSCLMLSSNIGVMPLEAGEICCTRLRSMQRYSPDLDYLIKALILINKQVLFFT